MLFVGKLIKDVDFKIVGAKNSPLAKFTLAVGKDDEGKTKFLNCIAWFAIGSYVNTINKQESVLVSGVFEESKYPGKDGEEKTSKVFVCDFAIKQPKASEKSQSSDTPNNSTNGDFTEIGDDSELPF
jgi:single-stranded DNA-binding protein